MTPQDSQTLTADEWKLVPVEPTKEMINAIWQSGADEDCDDVYRAMIAAAPSPLSGEAVQWTEAHNAAAYLQHHIGEGDEGACNALDTIDKFILSRVSPLTNEPVGVTISLGDAKAIIAGISDNPKFPKALALRARLSAAIGERG